MYEHFIDKFEWFARADDDVFVRTDKLEKFLRSIDSLKPQFIGEYELLRVVQPFYGFVVVLCTPSFEHKCPQAEHNLRNVGYLLQDIQFTVKIT